MNELRMYVEHLFEGRVLTQESIELKEEIYGNLVARYEDYVAGGMSEAEALETTKASFTSIEDVFKESGEAEGSNAGEAASAHAGESGAASWNAGAAQAAPGADGMGSAAEAAPRGSAGAARWRERRGSSHGGHPGCIQDPLAAQDMAVCRGRCVGSVHLTGHCGRRRVRSY